MIVWSGTIDGGSIRAKTKKELLDMDALSITKHEVNAKNVFKLLDDALSGNLTLKPDMMSYSNLEDAPTRDGWQPVPSGGISLGDL
jgi:hypothetical protein